MPVPFRVLVPVAAAALALALGGCGAAEPADTYGVDPAAPTALTPPAGTVLTANSTARLGTVVIDGAGWTLYRFDGDSAEPPTATCVDACAAAWPPVLAEPGSPLQVEGVEEAAVGTVTRPDGGVQITLGGRPLYRFAAETAPGGTAGHGVDGAWFAVTPEGGRAEAP
jgi:predicted lipoprotein with Yx(FWY)xxD motif